MGRYGEKMRETEILQVGLTAQSDSEHSLTSAVTCVHEVVFISN